MNMCIYTNIRSQLSTYNFSMTENNHSGKLTQNQAHPEAERRHSKTRGSGNMQCVLPRSKAIEDDRKSFRFVSTHTWETLLSVYLTGMILH